MIFGFFRLVLIGFELVLVVILGKVWDYNAP